VLKFFRLYQNITEIYKYPDGNNENTRYHSVYILSKKLIDLKKSQKHRMPAKKSRIVIIIAIVVIIWFGISTKLYLSF